jgi:hypothetical protein
MSYSNNVQSTPHRLSPTTIWMWQSRLYCAVVLCKCGTCALTALSPAMDIRVAKGTLGCGCNNMAKGFPFSFGGSSEVFLTKVLALINEQSPTFRKPVILATGIGDIPYGSVGGFLLGRTIGACWRVPILYFTRTIPVERRTLPTIYHIRSLFDAPRLHI